MKNVFIDTDFLIYIASGTFRDEDEILIHLEQLINRGTIQLLVPEVLKQEWERNKQLKVRDTLPKTLSDRTKVLRDLKPYLKTEQYDKLNQAIKEVTEQVNYFQDAIENRIARIEAILNHRRTVHLPIIDDVRVQASQMAYTKKMPFKKGKNSMGDALNFLTCIEYPMGTNDRDIHFISHNKSDFGKEDNQSILHDELNALANEKGVNVHYSIDIAQKLQDFGAFIKPETKKNIQEVLDLEWGYNRYGIPAVIECCGETLSEQAGIYMNGNLYKRCLKCGRYYDSGISFD